MRLAREATLRAQVAGEPPFGAMAVSAAGEPLAVTADSLVAAHDFTQDADTNAVGDASRRRGPDLGGRTLYAT